MKTSPDDQAIRLAAALDGFARRFKLAAAGAGKPLAEIDRQILHHVAANPDCGPTELARHFAMPMTTISSATDRLAKRGLLLRLRPAEDRRAVALRLSDAGAAFVAAQTEAYTAMFRAMLDRLTPQERTSLVAMMEKIHKYET
ncbi:MarR family winged helix-turn-helix transcriptional regulator [Halodurantibacterium flavum]|uniref:MarR family winged helix-turn-helix transcriptional regulator n=1 Tax=Halodurantibacterium flavum TaxID=1382802 RepID=A0ABW4S681_9RHOB